MSALPVVGAAIFGIVSVVLLVVAVRGRARTLRRGSALGLRAREVRASDRAWRVAHRAAWPILAADAAVALFHALGCLVAGLAMGADGAAFAQALVVSGAVVVVALWVVASAAGRNAAARLDT